MLLTEPGDLCCCALSYLACKVFSVGIFSFPIILITREEEPEVSLLNTASFILEDFYNMLCFIYQHTKKTGCFNHILHGYPGCIAYVGNRGYV